MLTISPFVLSILIQLIILLAAASGVLFFWVRKLQNRLKTSTDETLSPMTKDEGAQVDLKHYLATEIKLTKGRLDTLYTTDESGNLELIEPDWLNLRTQYLELETELSENKQREDAFWKNYGDHIRRVLTKCRLVKRLPLKEISELSATAEPMEADMDLNSILREQAEELEQLVAEMDGDEQVDLAQLKGQLESVAHRYREIFHCAFTMEDENRFLRDQIQALLQS